MNKKVSKSIKILVLSLICGGCILAGIGVTRWSAGEHLVVTLDDGTTRSEVYHKMKNIYQKVRVVSGDAPENLMIRQGGRKSTSVYIQLEKDGAVVWDTEQKMSRGCAKVQLPFECESGEYDINIQIQEEDGVHNYVSTPKAFMDCISQEQQGEITVTQMCDLDMKEQEITITEPFTWETNGCIFHSKAKMNFSSQTEGRMVILNKKEESIATGDIFCDTPQWEYQITHVFGNFKENTYYYINARRVNNCDIDNTLLVLDTKEKAEYLMAEGCLQVPAQVQTVRLCGKSTYPAMVLTRALHLQLAENADVDGVLQIQSDEVRKISIDTSEAERDWSEKIQLEAPGVSVEWKGNQLPSSQYVEQYMNVMSYNGQERNPYVGGSGTVHLAKVKISGHKGNVLGNYAVLTDSYADPVHLDNIKEKVKLDGEGTYTVEEHDGEYYIVIRDQAQNTRGYKIYVHELEHTLPVVYINTEDGNTILDKENYKEARISIDYNGNGDYDAVENVKAGVRGRGNSSWKLEKKPYKIKFDSKTSLFGLTKAKKWVLVANHVDRTLLRNMVAFAMAKKLDHILFTPNANAVDVFVNGEYQGVYMLCEQIEVKKGRIEAEEDSNELDTDYLLEIGGGGRSKFSTDLCRSVEVLSPDEDVVMLDQVQYLEEYFKQVDEAVKNRNGYENYIDVPSLIDWFLLNELTYNVDGTFRRSDFLLKKKGGKVYMAAPWDFDYALGNFSLDSENYEEWICNGNAITDNYKDKYIKENWLQYLLKDPDFQKQVKARWKEVGQSLRDTALSTIDEQTARIGNSAEENFTRYDNMFGTRLQYEKRVIADLKDYNENIQYLKDFIEKRYEWMDKTIQEME